MGIETLVPLAVALVVFVVWRLVARRDRPDGTPTDPNAPKGSSQ